MTSANNTPLHDSPETLFERFFDGSIDRTEAENLLKILQDDPEWGERFFQEHRDDTLLRFFVQTKKRPLPVSPRKKQDRLVPPASLPDSYEIELQAISRLVDERRSLETNQAEEAEENVSLKDAAPERPVVKPVPKQRSFLLPMAAALLVGVLSTLIYFEWFPRDENRSVAAGRSGAIATITGCLDVQWLENGGPAPGKTLGNETIRFHSGTVEILFFNGVHAVVEGPADFVLSDRNQIFCRRGHLSVTVPKQGRGFEIQTRQTLLRDLGTRFSTEIDELSTRIDVIQGLVEFEQSGTEKTALKTSQGAALPRTGPVERFSADPGRFVDRLEMQRRFETFFLRSPDFLSGKASKPSKPYYSIDFVPESFNAEFYGGIWIPGSRPESQAFRFLEQSDRIRLRTSGELKSFTAIVRLRIDQLNTRFNPILASEGNPRGGVLWHVSQQGAVVFGIRHGNNRQAETFSSPIVFTEERLGRETQLAVTFDEAQGNLTLYLDGSPILTDKLSRSTALNLSGLDLGNWIPTKGKPETFRQLDGAIDGFALYDRSWTSDEIRRHFFERSIISDPSDNNPKGAENHDPPEKP